MYFLPFPIEEEELEKKKFDVKTLKFLFPYFKSQLPLFILVNILLLLGTGIWVISPVLLKRILN